MAAFLVSGSTGLIYELVWTRAASTWFGVSSYAISTILSAFLVGLALGGWLGGWWLSRFPGTRPLRAYAAAEIGVALSALAVQAVVDHAGPGMVWIAHTFPGFGAGPIAVRFLAVGALLLVPTVLMGATFPLFTCGLTQGERTVQRSIAMAYGINVIGAACGCAVTAWVLLEAVGMHGAVWTAAGLNVAAAAGALVADRASARGPAPQPPPVGRKGKGSLPSRGWILGLVSMSGCAAMAYEVVWSRIYRQALDLRNPFLAFALVLTIVLVGMGLGSLVLSRGDRTRYAATPRRRLVLFGAIQAALALLAVLCLADVRFGLAALLPVSEARAGLWVSVATLCTPALLMGLCFPLLGSVYVRDAKRLGMHLGQIYAASTVFGVLGSLLGGFVLIPVLGLQTSLLALGALNAVCAGLALAAVPTYTRSARFAVPGALAAVLVIAAVVTNHRPEFSYTGKVLFLHDGLEASTAVIDVPSEMGNILYTNGVRIPPSFSGERTVLPVALVGHARRVLLIGFGTGSSAKVLLQTFPDIEVDCVELDDNQSRTTPFFGTEEILDDPRFHLYLEDGRQFMLRSEHRYDAIVIDSFGQSINQEFYNIDFFRQAEAILADDGLFFAKVPIAALASPEEVEVIVRSAVHGFAYTYFLHKGLFPAIIGRKNPLELVPADELDPPLHEVAHSLYEIARTTITPVDSSVFDRMTSEHINSDEWPYFFEPQRTERQRNCLGARLEHLLYAVPDVCADPNFVPLGPP